MRRAQASIWLACLFFLWTNAQTTEEVSYRQHYYDHGDDYDHSGQDTEHYYAEHTNGETDGAYGTHDATTETHEWDASAHTTGGLEDTHTTHETAASQEQADIATTSTEEASYSPDKETSYQPETPTRDAGTTSGEPTDVGDASEPAEPSTTYEYDVDSHYGSEASSTSTVQTSEAIEPSVSTDVQGETSTEMPTTKKVATTTERGKTLPPEAGWTEADAGEGGCLQGQLACDDGACIDASLICNGKKDCKGGEDEDPSICEAIEEDLFNRSATRPAGPKSNLTFICDSGDEIALENAYDTIEDCKDGSDESDRGREEKMAKCFQCEVDGMCLSPSVLCNDVVDCANGADEDEINCQYVFSKTLDISDLPAALNLSISSVEEPRLHGVIILSCTLGDGTLDELFLKNVTWYKDGVPLSRVMDADTRYGSTQNVLHVSNLQQKDSGEYTCKAELRNGTMLTTSMHVQVPTAVVEATEETTVETVTTATEAVPTTEGPTQTEEFTREEELTETEERIDEVPEGSAPAMTDIPTEEIPDYVPPIVPMPDREPTTTEEQVQTELAETSVAPRETAPVATDTWYAVQTGTTSTPERGETPAVATSAPTEETSLLVELTSPAAAAPTEEVTYEEVPSTDLQSIIDRQEQQAMREEASPGEVLVLRCPLPPAVPFEAIEEMYWMHNGIKIPMSIHRDDHMGSTELVASRESEGVWDCYIKSGEKDYKLGYNFVQIRPDEDRGVEYESTSPEKPTDMVATAEKTTPEPPTRIPTHAPLPTEEQLIEWITTTEAPYTFRLKAEPSLTQVRSGDTVSVSCSADNLPPGVAIYFIKTRPYGLAIGEVSEQHEGRFANYTLTIRGIRPLSSGEYQCIAVTEDRRAVKVDFRVEVSDEGEALPPTTPHYPVFTVHLQVDDAMYPANQRAEVKCTGVKPEDHHRIRWSFNDKEIPADDPAYQMEGSSLFVRRMGPQYAGIYSCNAVGSPGVTYQPASGKLLLQTDKFVPSFDVPPGEGQDVYTDVQSKSISQGDALTIDCFSRYPAISYTWYQLKNGDEIPMGNEQQLHIPFVHEVGSATYVCRVNTEYGEIKGTVVSVSVAARAPDEQELFTSWIEPQSQDVAVGATVYLTCRSSKPFRSLTWERKSQDGTTAQVGNEPTLIIASAGLADAGQYTCSVVSDDGDFARSTAHLTIQPSPPVDTSLIYREIKRCGIDEATCRDGTCIKRNLICDGKPDCPDGTDEKGCGGPGPQDGECHPDQIMCLSDRKCVQKIWVCDGENDCEDGTDEAPRYCEMMPPGTSRACKPSEFQCKTTNFTQCIPRSYVCDESIDCPDQSDEIGCVKPTVTNPPESEKQVNVGETLMLRCTARGTPLPFINWRLNWGFICGDGYDNGRCIMAHEFDSRYPDVVVGVLTIRNMQPADAGAYSCEAINNKGFHFAVPDAFVQVRGAGLVPQGCHPFGTAFEENGSCHCKINVFGPTCAECKSGYYHLASDNLHGCLGCFCSGVSKQCTAETSMFETILVDLGDAAGQTWQVVHETYPENRWMSPDVRYDRDENSVSVTSLQSAPYGQLYWQPFRVGVFPLGNLIRSYGGDVVIKLRVLGDDSPLRLDGPLLRIRGNKIELINTTRTTLYPQDGVFTTTVRLCENSFTRLDGSPVDRAHMMMALANVDRFWIYAGQGGSRQPMTIVSVSLEVATPSGTGRLATSVEKCTCPQQYTGSSCERCAPGYTRHEGVGLYLGECYSCREHCHGKTDSCNPDTGECYNCGQNTAGPRCEQCMPGFQLNPVTGQCEPGRAGEIQAAMPRIMIDDIEYRPPRTISILVRPGERRIIRVTSQDVPLAPSSVWLRVEQSGQRVPLPSGMRQDGYNLLIDSVSPHMLGEYEARLTFIDGRVATPTILIQYDQDLGGRAHPTLEPHGIVRKMLNEDLIITVNLNGFPASRIVWTKDHQQLPAQVIQEVQRLVIHRLSPELCGTYEATLFPELPLQPMVLQTTIECVPAPAGVGEPEMTYGPPKITLLPSEVNLAEGQTMVVTYEIVGEQPVDIVWKKLEDGSILDMPPSFSILRDKVVLNDSRIEDTGIYRVEATNRFGRDEAILRLIVKEGTLPKSFGAAEPQVHFERTVYEVMPGERIHIVPRIQSSAAYHVRWTDGNGDPLPAGVYSDGDGLLIQSMTENLAGSYVIEVTTSEARVRVPVEIVIVDRSEHQVHGQPMAHEQGSRFDVSLPSQLSVEAGSPFEIKCEVSGVDERQLIFSWKKHGHDGAEPLPANVQADGQILRGVNVQPSDYAYYMCQAENPHTGQQAVAYTLLNVQNRKVRPVARIFPTNSVQVSLGDSASFTCYAQEGEPTPTAAWSRVDGRPIMAPSRSYNGQLDLLSISKDDAGQYRCLLTNEAGHDEAIADVQIEAPPEIRLMINPEELPNMDDETPAYVQCIASGIPTPLVYWTHNYKNVTTPDLGYSLLLIQPSTLSGRNVFECVATNAHDRKTRQIVANVLTQKRSAAHHNEIDGHGLHITTRPSEPQVGDDVLLTCSLGEGPPLSRPATYTWAKDGHHLITNMNLERFDIHFIKQATEYDAGEYECTVSDGMRHVGQTTFSLTLKGETNSPSVEQRNAVEGVDVELSCKQRVTPVLRVHWSRQDGQLPPTSTVVNGVLRIENVQRRDAGIYICTSWDGEQVHEDHFNLTVNIAALTAGNPRNTPLATLVATPTTFAYGAKVTLQCVTHSKEPFTYSWLKDGRPTLRSGVSIKGSEISLYVQHSDLGIYTCDVARPTHRDIAGSASIEMIADPVRIGLVNIVAAEKPTPVHVPARTHGDKARRPVLIKIRPLQGDYHLNGQVGFECDTSATNAVIRWERRAPTILMSPLARTEMNRIMFERFTHEDSGEYVCIVEKNGQVHEKILHLDIDLSNQDVLFTYPEHPLVISHGAPNINVTFLNPPSEFKRGGNIEVECIVSGQRDAPITWTREQKNMSSNTFIRGNILKFHHFLEHNLGEYRCSARTNVGELSKIIVFEPESFPGISMNASRRKMKIDFQFLSSRSDFRAGGHVVVECVTSDPHARVTWRKLGRPASPGMRIKDRFLIISPFSSDDLGTYECKAFSRLGAVVRSIEFDKHDLSANVLPVNEEVLPNVEMKLGDKNTYQVGGKIDITCEVSNDPSARVNWHRGERKQLGPRTEFRDNTLRFHDVSAEDAGIYSCFATNTHGSKYISFEVQISPDGKVHIVNEQENTIPTTRTRIPLITEFLTPLSQFKKGGEITIICYFANDVPGRIEWKKVSDDLRRVLPLQSSAQIIGSKLRFSSFDQNDLGSYQCTGYGEHGSVKKIVKLDADTFSVLKRLPQRYNQEESEDLQIVVTGNEIGQRVKLWCKMGSTRLAVKWEFDGGSLPDDKDVVQIGTRLLFNKFLPRHHGIYTCRARYNGTKLLKHIDTRMYIKNTGENGIAKWLLF